MKKGILLTIVAISLFLGLPASAETIPLADINSVCQCQCHAVAPIVNSSDSDEGTVLIESAVVNYSPGDILISEVVSIPNDGELEWVELYNTSDRDIDLTDWKLMDGAGRSSTLSGMVAAGAYIVFNKSGLNDGGDKVILKSPVSIIIDQLTYGNWDDGETVDNAPAAKKGESIARRDISTDYNIDFQDFGVTNQPTPGVLNIIDESSSPIVETSDNTAAPPVANNLTVEEQMVDIMEAETLLRINEILPNPTGTDTGQEWIELYNYGADDVNLRGWKLDDIDGGSTPYEFKEDKIIEAHGYAVFKNDVTKIALNNDTDSARLISSDGVIVDQVDYNKVYEGQSYNYYDNGWQWGDQLTPGAENANSSPTAQLPAMIKGLYQTAAGPLAPVAMAAMAESKSSTGKSKTSKVVRFTEIENIRDLDVGTLTKVKGTVAVLPGVFGKQVMYLDGLQLYNSQANWPNMSVGQSLETSGKVSISGGEIRLNLGKNDAMVVGGLAVELAPLEVKAEGLGMEVVGRLVTLTGEVIQTATNKITMADDTGEFTVYLKQNSGVSKKNFQEKDQVKIVGILSQSDAELRVLPRSINDVEILNLKAPVDNSTPVKVSAVAAAFPVVKVVVAGLLVVVAIGYVLIRRGLVRLETMKSLLGRISRYFLMKKKIS